MQKDFCQTYRTYFSKHTLIEEDICRLSNERITEIINDMDVDVVIGGPPCQGFSIAGNIGRKFADDPRNHLFKEFVRVVDVIKPKFFIMENVAKLYTHNRNQTREEIMRCFSQLGYSVECQILNSADYGVPQIRKRTIFIGSKTNNKIIFPHKTCKRYRTVQESIGDLPYLASGESSHVLNHKAMKHTEQMLHKMHFVNDGGTRKEIPLELRPRSGDARKYIRYQSNKPSVTITGDMRKVFHYAQNRALTVRELARLQTFPDTFEFKGSVISQQQQIGNAVPPLMAKALADCIKDMMDVNDES